MVDLRRERRRTLGGRIPSMAPQVNGTGVCPRCYQHSLQRNCLTTQTLSSYEIKPSCDAEASKDEDMRIQNVESLKVASAEQRVENTRKSAATATPPAKRRRKRTATATTANSQKTQKAERYSFDGPSVQLLDKIALHYPDRILPKDLHISSTTLGEGNMGIVKLGTYKGLAVACKHKRTFTRFQVFTEQAVRELEFASRLSACRYINRYFGWAFCFPFEVSTPLKKIQLPHKNLYIIQRHVANGDARSYLNRRDSVFKPQEVLQASICLFAALSDAHAIDIGIVDLKLENFLIDSSGTSWLTDFGSCVEMGDRDMINLDEEGVGWTKNVAPPEMYHSHKFSKASDVFMAMLIMAELMTADVSDNDFQEKVLGRDRLLGQVSVSFDLIHERYSDFFPLLETGLKNKPSDRPTAESVLSCLQSMKV